MGKRDLKSLKLNKRAISNFKIDVKSGLVGADGECYGSCFYNYCLNINYGKTIIGLYLIFVGLFFII